MVPVLKMIKVKIKKPSNTSSLKSNFASIKVNFTKIRINERSGIIKPSIMFDSLTQ